MTIQTKPISSATNLMKYLLSILILFVSLSGTCQVQVKKGNLKVVVNNMKSRTGQLGIFLFNSGDAFPTKTENAILSGFVKISGNTVEYTFASLATGTYAIYVFHDEDNNKKLNSNFIGMPKEGVGVSNNAKGHFGPPKYDDAKFVFNKSDQTIRISLTYL